MLYGMLHGEYTSGRKTRNIADYQYNTIISLRIFLTFDDDLHPLLLHGASLLLSRTLVLVHSTTNRN